MAAATPAQATKDDGLNLVVPTLAAMLPGQQGWISAMWSANLHVCDVEVKALGGGVTVSYPANTATYSSFYTNSALATGNMDYTALKVAVPASVTSSVTLTLNVSYVQMIAGVMAAVAATTPAGCASDTGDAPAASAPVSAGFTDTRTPQQRAEDAFITARGVHLCTVQSTVYEDPKKMAEAYASEPL